MLVLGFEEIKEVKGSFLFGWKFDLSGSWGNEERK